MLLSMKILFLPVTVVLSACAQMGTPLDPIAPTAGETRIARFERVTTGLQSKAAALVHDALGLDRSGIPATVWGPSAKLAAACHLQVFDKSLGRDGTDALIGARESVLTARLSRTAFIDRYIEVQETLPPAVEAAALRQCGPIEPVGSG